MNRRIPAVLAVGSFVAVAALVPSTSRRLTSLTVVEAQNGCSASTLHGSYAFIQPAGYTTPGRSVQGNQVPWQFVGVATFDGAGNVSINYTAAVNGDIFTNQSSSGTYDVSSSCAGSMSFATGNASGSDANLAIVSGGTEAFGIFTNQGDTASFDLKKQ